MKLIRNRMTMASSWLYFDNDIMNMSQSLNLSFSFFTACKRRIELYNVISDMCDITMHIVSAWHRYFFFTWPLKQTKGINEKEETSAKTSTSITVRTYLYGGGGVVVVEHKICHRCVQSNPLSIETF